MSGSSQILTRFSGPSVTSTYPPHNGLAAGPNNIVMVEGSRIEWTNLAGGAPALQSTYNFFAPLAPTGSLYDPRVVYDSVNQRFVAIMEYGASGNISSIDIAVSKDSNPNDGWTFASLNTALTINGQLTGSDRPMLTVDGSNIYITAEQDNFNVSGSPGTETWVISDTSLYSGGTPTIVASQLLPASQGVFTEVAGNNGKTYYASSYSNGSQIVVSLQAYDKATNTFGPTSTIGLGQIDQGGSYTAQQQGTSLLLNAGDKRVASLAYSNGFLWGVTEEKPAGSSVPLVHWFKINVSNPSSPTLVAQGNISGATLGSNVATFNPSLAIDAAGDVLINFSASGPNLYPQDYYVYQLGSDPAGSFSAPILYQASTGFFNSGNGSSVQPWGYYSTTVVDPNNPNTFWISNEYVANGWWQTAVAQVAIQNTTAPTIASITASGTGITGGSGDLGAGQVVLLTVNFSGAVTVNTTAGSPTLALNDGGTATYTGGSGSSALAFSYTVLAGQTTPDLTISAFNLNGATIADSAGNAANLTAATNYNPAGVLQINTTAPTIASITASGTGITSGSGDLNAGKVVTLTVNFSGAVTVNTAGGSPTLALNDGGTATYTGGSGTSALTFSYTVAAGQNTPDLTISAFNLNGATIADSAGNAANLTGATNDNPIGTLQIDTTAPTVASIVPTGTGITNGTGNLSTGQVVTLTVNFSEAVTVSTAGGSPTLALNDGGTATYTGGSGTSALTFGYTVATGQNTPDLAISAFNLNGAAITDGAGNAASLSGATNYNPAGTLQINNTTALTITSIAATGTGITNGNGDLNAGKVVTLTVNFSGAVTVNTSGGSPTVTLNDGGTATYTGGSGSSALTFTYTVAAGQNTADLVVSALGLNGATIADGAGNAVNLSGATNDNPGGILQVDTTPPIPVINQAPPSTTASTSALFAFGTSNIETTGITYAYKLDGAASWTSLSGNSLSLSGLASGAHSIQMQATDAAGNLSAAPASYSWTVNPTPPQIATQFSGPSVTSTYPPHNGLALGPNNIVMVEGSRVEWTNLAGGSPVVQSTYNFFAPLAPTGGLYDQRIAYDSVNQRFVLIMDYGASGNISSIDIAVSKDSNPNDGWTFASLNTALTINGQLTGSDRPMLTVDGSNIYITAEQDNFNVSGSPGTETWVISDTGLYNGGTPTIVASQLLPASQGVFTEVTGNNGKTYYASSYSNGSQIVVTLQVYDKATNTFGPTSTIGLGQIGQGGSFTAQQQGTNLLLDVGDNRIANLAYSNGFLWGVTEEMPPGSNVPLVHWFKIDVSNPSSPTLVAQGNISGATLGSNVATFNPSLAIDAAGDVLINFTASGPNLYPQDYYVYQLGSGPVGSFSAPILYQASTGFFNSGDGSSVQRWGLYSTTIVDPNNPNTFWISNEYVANGWWQTAVAQVAIPVQPTAPTLTVASSSLNLPAGGSVPLGISVSPANPGNNVTVSGLTAYETITDALDHITFSGNANTLSAAEVNSGLTLNSTFTGSGQPVNTLTVVAGITTAAGTANSAAKTITITDPSVTTIAAAQLDQSAALLTQFAAAGLHNGASVPGSMTNTALAFASEDAKALLSSPRHLA
jgi:hypothetical protein